VYLLTDIESESPVWTKVAQVSAQSHQSETCKLVNSVMEAVKIDTLTTPEGAEGYFIRAVDPEGSLFAEKQRPTLLVIHGGPHGHAPKDMFMHSRLLWVSLGYNLLVVNYRGSTGYGLKQCEALSGNVLEMDADDCMALLEQCLQKFADEIDSKKLGVYGGSHGGFLTCCLVSHPEWCDKFAAACIWNPVTAMHSALLFSDIPDWHHSVALNKPHEWTVTKEDMNSMYDRSPISRVDNVKTPSLFIIGGDDRRVPAGQGMYFWKSIKARGIETEMHYYEKEGHGVTSTEEGFDALMNMTNWWIDHL